MPHLPIPHSGGEDNTPYSYTQGAGIIKENNYCHLSDGRLAPKGQGQCSSGSASDTLVGITSARPGKPSKEVFAQMRGFERDLKAIPTVSSVRVQPGLGAWEGGSEPTWVVSYRGNGEARRLLAKTGRQYNQDAVLVLSGTHGTSGSPMVEFAFEGAVRMNTRKAIHKVLVGAGLGGWTWMKSSGKTVLRAVCVPQWGGVEMAHMKASKQVSDTLGRLGLKHTTRVRRVRVEILEREGEHSYEQAIAA